MSMSKWAIYGYGAYFMIDEVDTKKIISFLKEKEYLDEEELEYFETMEEVTFSDIEQHWGCFYEFLSELSTFEEFEGINKYISFTDEGDGECFYLLYTPNLPWKMSKQEVSLSEKDVENMISSIISILTNLDNTEISKRFDLISTGGEG